jgi:hypothetical protein
MSFQFNKEITSGVSLREAYPNLDNRFETPKSPAESNAQFKTDQTNKQIKEATNNSWGSLMNELGRTRGDATHDFLTQFAEKRCATEIKNGNKDYQMPKLKDSPNLRSDLNTAINDRLNAAKAALKTAPSGDGMNGPNLAKNLEKEIDGLQALSNSVAAMEPKKATTEIAGNIPKP